jgi:hypothetical protein
MCSVRDLFRVSVSKPLVNGSGASVDCVNGRTVIASWLVPASYRVIPGHRNWQIETAV